MLIILEGVDLSGKTTLANALDEKLSSTHIVHRRRCGQLKQNALNEYLVPLADITQEDVWIFDRLHMGELIYGPVFRGGSQLTMAQTHYIELVLNQLGAVRVHVQASTPTLLNRYSSRGDDLVSQSQMLALKKHYTNLMMDFPQYLNVFTDVEHTGIINADLIVTQCVKNLRTREPFVNWNIPQNYLGPLKPSVLILGDRQGPRVNSIQAQVRTTPLPWPFVPYGGTSGHWLFQSMLDAGVNLYEIGITNANECTDHELNALWTFLGTPPVVTLGNNAKKATKAAYIPSEAHLPHPQYARRFQYHQRVQYAQPIKDIQMSMMSANTGASTNGDLTLVQ